jgi:DnaJ-class molecular chaperone
MADTKECKTCNGTGKVDCLVSQHDDKKEVSPCPDCKGRKVIHYMSEEDEADYHADFW